MTATRRLAAIMAGLSVTPPRRAAKPCHPPFRTL
jgi:hypothetical protein